MTRYAIWHWRDADGLSMIPCGVISALAKTRYAKAGKCSDQRPFLKTHSRALRMVARLHDLVDDENRLTERGAVVRSTFLRRDGVLAGWETAHGETIPY
ncbi:hypothetical protein [Sphingomonas tagetis]|uniref:hypothetical protein n=1 Tax=Sphingomonas tagetis TaxID=2949092 RepID=UPI0020B6C668|nr:hypothetical protein [Sphingomonas tagetis]